MAELTGSKIPTRKRTFPLPQESVRNPNSRPSNAVEMAAEVYSNPRWRGL